MGTWFKKFSYSTVTKFLAIVVLCVAVLGGLVDGISIVRGIEYGAYESSYEETSDFLWEHLVPTAGYVRDWIVRYTDDGIFDPEQVDVALYEPNYATEYRNIANKGLSEEDHKEEIQKLEARIRNEVIRDRKIHFAQLQRELVEKPMNLQYLAIDVLENKVVTNIKNYDDSKRNTYIEQIKHMPGYLVGDETKFSSPSYNYGGHLWSSEYYEASKLIKPTGKPYEIYVAPVETITVKDAYANADAIFNTVKYEYNNALEQIWLYIGVALLMVIYLTAVAGRKAGKEGVQMMAIDNIPFEIQGIGSVIVVFLTAMGVSISLDRLFSGALDMWTSQMQFYNYTIRILTIGGGLILLAVCLSIVRHLKNKSFWRNTLLGKVWYVCKENMLDAKTLPLGITLGFIVFIGINGILAVMIFGGSGFLFILATLAAFVFNGMTLIALFKIANDFRVLAQGAKRIEAGDLEYKISLSHTMPAMKEMARTINNIGDGLSNSVDKALRSEKMKTELITNVSHDLKTPLTSIISYIDLLKAEDIESEAAREYIEIISERGERLKILIQDLVEASKAATGNIAVNLETLELGQFVQQAVGEYTDRLEMNGLNIVMQCEEEVYVAADGRHMWRVVENLLSNVAKYAMSHTRVYMDVTREDEWGIVTIKNISREQLAGKESFLTERFVRGDEARSTEGSGLGLAIANSLIGMQKGRLAIEVDGDLFKVKVALPISQEQEEINKN